MYLIEMRSEQIRSAVQKKIPLIMPAGVLECHGPHLPVGTDLLIAEAVCRAIEKDFECVVAPSFSYGSTMNWAGGPADGEMDFAPQALYTYAWEVFSGLIHIGFRRIYVMQHHQGSDGLQALGLKLAATELIREITQNWESGWGRKPPADWPIPEIFELIKVAHPDSFLTYLPQEKEAINFQHAGKCETAFILASNPRSVCLDSLNLPDWQGVEWLQNTWQADAESGTYWISRCADSWIKELNKC